MKTSRRGFLKGVLGLAVGAGVAHVAGPFCKLPEPAIIVPPPPEIVVVKDIPAQVDKFYSSDLQSWILFPEFINRQLRVTPLANEIIQKHYQDLANKGWLGRDLVVQQLMMPSDVARETLIPQAIGFKPL